jgi:hypothetical protein
VTEPAPARSLALAINRAALGIALGILVAIGVFWWRDRTQKWEPPRWQPARFALVSPPADSARERWIVAVNPDCPHCRARLAELLRRPRDPEHGPALGVLLVDLDHRPLPLETSSRLEAGAWWDSAGVWRSRWGHRVYGEVLVFAPDGAFERTVGPELDPQAAAH